VKIEYIKPDKLDAGTTIKGLECIDVPGLTTRDYKLSFHSHKECQPLIKVCYSPCACSMQRVIVTDVCCLQYASMFRPGLQRNETQYFLVTSDYIV